MSEDDAAGARTVGCALLACAVFEGIVAGLALAWAVLT